MTNDSPSGTKVFDPLDSNKLERLSLNDVAAYSSLHPDKHTSMIAVHAIHKIEYLFITTSNHRTASTGRIDSQEE